MVTKLTLIIDDIQALIIFIYKILLVWKCDDILLYVSAVYLLFFFFSDIAGILDNLLTKCTNHFLNWEKNSYPSG